MVNASSRTGSSQARHACTAHFPNGRERAVADKIVSNVSNVSNVIFKAKSDGSVLLLVSRTLAPFALLVSMHSFAAG